MENPKDFLENSGYSGLFGSKNVARTAFEVGLIDDGSVWMDMIKSRNLTSACGDDELLTPPLKLSHDVIDIEVPFVVTQTRMLPL
ncbi:MAG: hypothetical protein ACJAV1_001926 [Paraglaciecola sp.]|jgi:hypothetical protein